MTTGQKVYGGLRFWCLFLAVLAIADLSLMLVLVVIHAAHPYSVDVALLNPLMYILTGSASASVFLGTLWYALRYPNHRRAIAIVVIITFGIMAAHLYTINTPAPETPASVQGQVGTTFNDSIVQVNSNISGSTLSVTVTDVSSGGSDVAVADLQLSLNGVTLPSSDFVTQPTITSALQPEGAADGYPSSVSGTWQVNSSGTLALKYQQMTCYHLAGAGSPPGPGCVMDEVYYVPAALTLLAGTKCGPYISNCNLEHPFLSKAFIAASISIFGNSGLGWRFFIALLGTASIPVLFGICWKMSRDITLSLYATFLLAFESLFFVQSSIAVIDIPMIFFGLLAFLVYAADIHIWKFDKYILSGVLLALSALAKELAIFMVAFLVFFNLVYGKGGRLDRVKSSVEIFAVTALLFCAGLELYVLLFGATNLTSFVGDIQYILSYGSSLKCVAGQACGWSIFANGAAPYITPFDWLVYYFAVGYEVVRVTVTSGTSSYSYVSIGYFGVPNWLMVWFTFIWAPYVVYKGYKAWRAKRAPVPDSTQMTLDSPAVPVAAAVESGESPSFGLAKFALFWFLFTYVPYILLFAYGRVTYPYYFLSAIPALAIGTAYLISRKWFPREVAWIILAGAFAWFFIFYPDKSFLPTQLRVLLGH